MSSMDNVNCHVPGKFYVSHVYFVHAQVHSSATLYVVISAASVFPVLELI